MFFSSNIKLLRTRRGLTQDDFAQALQMKRPTLSGYENNVAQPNMETLMAMAEYFQLAIDTLVRVDLSKLSPSQLQELEQGNDAYVKGTKLRVLTKTVDQHNRENIELVPIKAKAGYTAGYNDPEYISSLPTFQLPFLSEDKSYRAFQIEGDSMLPVKAGSYVVAEFVQDWKQLKDGYAYILVTEDGVVFKVVYNEIRKKSKLLLKSLNTLYEPYEVPVSAVKEVWKFVNYFSDQLPTEFEAEEYNLKGAVVNLQQDMNRVKEVLEQLESSLAH